MTTSGSISKETRFTAGPWHHDPSRTNIDTQGTRTAGGVCGPKLVLATVWADGDITPDEALANATLMTAAPDFYAVVVDFMENPNFRVAVGGNPNAVDELMARARNALAKARGEDRSHEGK